MPTVVVNTKLKEVGNKIPVDSKYITTQEFNKLCQRKIGSRCVNKHS